MRVEGMMISLLLAYILFFVKTNAEAPVANYMANTFDSQPTPEASTAYGWRAQSHPSSYAPLGVGHFRRHAYQHHYYPEEKVDSDYKPFFRRFKGGKKHYPKKASRPSRPSRPSEDEEMMDEEPEEDSYYTQGAKKHNYNKKPQYNKAKKYYRGNKKVQSKQRPQEEEMDEMEDEAEMEQGEGDEEAPSGRGERRKSSYHSSQKKHYSSSSAGDDNKGWGWGKNKPYYGGGGDEENLQDIPEGYDSSKGYYGNGWFNTMQGGYDDYGYNYDSPLSSSASKGYPQYKGPSPSYGSAPSLSQYTGDNPLSMGSYSYVSGGDASPSVPIVPSFVDYSSSTTIQQPKKPSTGFGVIPFMSSLFRPSSSTAPNVLGFNNGGKTTPTRYPKNPLFQSQKEQQQQDNNNENSYPENDSNSNIESDSDAVVSPSNEYKQTKSSTRDIYHDDEDEMKESRRKVPNQQREKSRRRPQVQKSKSRDHLREDKYYSEPESYSNYESRPKNKHSNNDNGGRNTEKRRRRPSSSSRLPSPELEAPSRPKRPSSYDEEETPSVQVPRRRRPNQKNRDKQQQKPPRRRFSFMNLLSNSRTS